jgi:ADP-heptose:LPS heptosyltransferase
VARPFDDEPRSVAIVRLRTGLGDLLCTVPALRALRRRLPRAHVALITFGEMAPVVERMRPWVDELIGFPGYPGIPERPPRRARIAPFFEAVRARRFDLALQMYGASRAAVEVCARLGATRTGGFLPEGAAAVDGTTWIAYPEHEHEVRRHLRLMQHLGAESGDEALAFPLRPEDAAAVADELPSPYALLHPGATSPSRRWPPERFAAVGDALAQRGLRVAVVGTRDERRTAASVAVAMRARCLDACGRTDLGGLAVLLGGATLLVGNDSGPAHLAAALGTPSVTVFLSGDPVRWAHDPSRHRVARAQVECNPCSHLTCPIDHRCATGVTVARVVSEVDAVLGART